MALVVIDDSSLYANASAIRSKLGVQDLFKPSQMASAIEAIPTGGGASLGSKTITDNGTYYASADSLDGYSQVTVSVQGGGGGDFDAIIDGTLSELYNTTASYVREYAFASYSNLRTVQMDGVLEIGSYAFSNCTNLLIASFAACEVINNYAFYSCYSLTTANFPSCTDIKNNAFCSCFSLTTVDFTACVSIRYSAFFGCRNIISADFPACKSVYASAFNSCTKLASVNLPVCTYISSTAFADCGKLMSLYLTSVSVVPTLGDNAFFRTPIGGYSVSGQYGSVFVPASLYNDFLVASNWSYISDRIVSV